MSQAVPSIWSGAVPSAVNGFTRAQISQLLVQAPQDGFLVWCGEINAATSAAYGYYQYLNTSGASVDGATVLATRNGNLSRWIQLNISPGPPTPPVTSTWIDESASFNVVSGFNYMLHTSAGGITANLPGSAVAGGSPVNGQPIAFADADNDAGTNAYELNAAPLLIQQIGGGPPVTTLTINNNGEGVAVTWNTESNVYVLTG